MQEAKGRTLYHVDMVYHPVDDHDRPLSEQQVVSDRREMGLADLDLVRGDEEIRTKVDAGNDRADEQ